jgi:DNA-binding beta-propeller fold protein YncE
MKQHFALFVAIATCMLASEPARSQSTVAALKIVETFRIGGATDWDYPVFDPQSHRLYIACDDHVLVVDTKRGTRIGDIHNLKGAHGIAIAPDNHVGFVTSGEENAVAVFNPKTLKITRRIAMPKEGGKNPDPIVCGGGVAVAIDPANLDAPLTAIHCGGALEYGRPDGAGKLFVNNEDKSEIDVIDTKTMKLVDRWPLAPLESPSGLAIDLEHHHLFSVGENQKMVVIDYNNGKLLATVAIGEGADGCAFDPKLGLALSSNGDDGTVTVVRETSPGKFAAVQTLKTAKSGRTITNDPTSNRFYIPATLPANAGSPAHFGVLVLGGAT